MEQRQLGKSGFRIPVLSLGTGTFGGTNDFFKKWGDMDVKEASRLIDISLEHGLNFFDTANVYSTGAAEEILGAALKGRRDKSIISTKVAFKMGDGPNDSGASRYHIIRQAEESLKRLETDYIDLYFIHGFDPLTPIEETLTTLDALVKSGKVRYIGVSNYASWQLMKSLSVSEKLHLEKFIVYQGYYSIIGRDYEWDLMPAVEDQGLGLMVWSPLGWGRLTGKIKRNQPAGEGRIQMGGAAGGPEVEEDYLYDVIDVLDEIASETNKSIAQVSLNWLLTRKTVSNVVIGARNEKQLIENIGALGWSLTSEQLEKIDKVSDQKPLYPHWVGKR
ncbi:aldo/keto reductase [Chryseolinea sp. T2]|uniref:aldo/keto reductase n=1 Tax=Chryseolinea sp. T2 TaxID=3129255 RepID=UPI0030783D02